jgi:hypothetical protein
MSSLSSSSYSSTTQILLFFLAKCPRSFHSTTRCTIIWRIARKVEVTDKSKVLALRTLDEEEEMQSGLALSPPLVCVTTQKIISPSERKPLGMNHREPTKME